MSINVKQFQKGLITKIEDKDQARGSASDMLNWHSLGDHIELRRGQKLIGTENTGSGSVTGLKVGRRHDGVQFPFFTTGRKLFYIDVSANTSTEIGTDVLPVSAENEDISVEQYKSLAGDFMYVGSPNTGLLKIPVANPTSVVDLLIREYRGKFKIKQSRQFLWDRKDTFGGSDQTGIYLSHVDATEDVYDFTSAEELGTGDGATSSYSGTLAFKAANTKETAFFVVIAGAKTAGTSITAISQATSALVTSAGHGLAIGDTVIFAGVSGMTQINNRIGVVLTVPSSSTFTVNIDTTNFTAYSSGGTVYKSERFVDDRSGNLVGQDGGTGTINYATGAYAVNFTVPIINTAKIVAQYFREDSTKVTGSAPTKGGIANFSFSATRGQGEGSVFRQDDGGGKFMTAESFGDTEYCLHEFKTWALTLTSDDTNATNLIYRDNVGIPYHRAAKATGDGIYYVDAIGENPAVRRLSYGSFLSNIVPKSISDQLDLNAYSFDTAVVFEWGDYICMACKLDQSVNTRLFMKHKVWDSWEVHSFRCSTFDVLSGALIAGDAGSPNIFKLFSGLTDEDATIDNFYTTNNDYLDQEGVKGVNIAKIAGYIGVDQGLKVSYSLDYGPFVEIGGTDENVLIDDVLGPEILINSYSESNQSSYSGINYEGGIPRVGQTFTPSQTVDLSRMVFNLSKLGTVTGFARVKIFAMTGTYGTNGLPTGIALAVSDDVNVSVLTGSYQLISFNFSGDNQYRLDYGSYYCAVVEYIDGSAMNGILVGLDDVSPTDGGNAFYQQSGIYTTLAADLCYYLYGMTIVTPAYTIVVHHPLIEGNGSYVDQSQRKLIGSLTLGEEQIGGGQDPDNAIYASPYEHQFHVGTGRFERIRLKFEALGVGYMSVSEYGFVDIRNKGKKLPTKYIA